MKQLSMASPAPSSWKKVMMGSSPDQREICYIKDSIQLLNFRGQNPKTPPLSNLRVGW